MGLSLRQVGQSSFYAKFLTYLMIFESIAASWAIHVEKSSNMATFLQKLKKSLV